MAGGQPGQPHHGCGRNQARRGHAKLRARAGGEPPPAAVAGDLGALRGIARRGGKYPRRRGDFRRDAQRRSGRQAEAGIEHAAQAHGAHAEFGRFDAARRRGGARRGSGDRRLLERPLRTARHGFNSLELPRGCQRPAVRGPQEEENMSIKASEISDLIKARIDKFQYATEARNVGTVVSVTDGIVRIHGLADARYGEMLEFVGNTFGLALNLEQDSVGSVVLGDYKGISEGAEVKTTGRILEVPVGPELLGRVVDALGLPIDGKGPVNAKLKSPLERVAPGVIFRKSVSQPVQTGLKAIDSMVPIGRGQRELIIGDRQTGKTAVAIDTIINQKGTGVKCVYVAIGQKQSSIANVVRKLEEHGAMAHTIIVAASASTPAAMQYLAPYGGCAMGEYFMDNGEDALIVYDDLSKQAVAYRQISLLLRRPPGREAYPGDVFYLHSRLLERSARVNEEYVEKFTNGRVKGKTGSLTGIPIIETQAGDVTAFVPTNVISITDGQIFLETDLFNAGMRPAINAGISVSRGGGAAQTNIIKKLGGGVRLALAQYRELAAFSQFASDLDEATRRQLERGVRVTELMKQKQYAPMSVAEMALSLYAANNGYFDKVDRRKVVETETGLQSFARGAQADLLKGINAKPDLSGDVEASLKKCCSEFFATL